MQNEKKGFTMVELIIVIAIIAILAGIIFVAVDPARRLHEARNTRRNSDVSSILSALITYRTDSKGVDYSTVAALTADKYYVIGTDATGCNTTCTAQTTEVACVNLSALPTNYLATIPTDPSTGTAANTDYYLMKSSLATLTIGACDTEGEGSGGSGTPPVIKVAR